MERESRNHTIRVTHRPAWLEDNVYWDEDLYLKYDTDDVFDNIDVMVKLMSVVGKSTRKCEIAAVIFYLLIDHKDYLLIENSERIYDIINTLRWDCDHIFNETLDNVMKIIDIKREFKHSCSSSDTSSCSCCSGCD